MKQIVVLSGKGGAGKTTIAASFAVLASENHRIAVADCDVEASNLPVLLKPVELRERIPFKGSRKAVIHSEKCVKCGACVEACRFGAVVSRNKRSGVAEVGEMRGKSVRRGEMAEGASGKQNGERNEARGALGEEAKRGERECGGESKEEGKSEKSEESGEIEEDGERIELIEVNEIFCEGCGVCVFVCPADALSLVEKISGEICVSDAKCGANTVRMVHASLKAGEESSGKLVTAVRRKVSEIGSAEKCDIVLIDGPPGVGCPVIASLTGVDLAVLVAEPTRTGLHDLKRVFSVAKHFGVKSAVCVNKCDLNEEISAEIERFCAEEGIEILGRIPYDETVFDAVSACEPVVLRDCKASNAIKEVWRRIESIF